MEENRNNVFVDQSTGEIIESQTEEEKSKTLQNLRVVKVLLLGGNLYYDKKIKTKVTGMNVVFLDAVETDPKTGQPILRGFNPVISCYVKNPSVEIVSLLKDPVFTEKFIRISGEINS